MSRKNKIIPNADLSNAGDDFHILWTIKKSLELLNFDDNGLKTIMVEGYDKAQSKKIDPTGVNFLGIDLTEFYGGSDSKSAKSIIISQLKYSTNRIDENYTFSEFYKGKRRGSYDGSIIHRLSTVFKTLLDEIGREELLRKVKIKLVSNRNINNSHLKDITDIQNYLKTKNQSLSFNTILKKNTTVRADPFKKLIKASKLNLTEFTDFIRLLDFEDCGANSRANLKMELINAISKTSITSNNQFNSVFKMIWDKMMPEQRNDRAISFINVVTSFGFSSIENLFPVNQDFEKNSNSIKREQLNDILNKIQSNNSYLPICIHGDAGIGKSTIIQQIKNNLPEYSECILFDCYGAGKYQNTSDKRHLHKNAIVQLANELAQKIGTEFMLIKNETDDVYLKEFVKRLNNAVEILKHRNLDAFLTIIIDAADNSVTAAKNNGEKSFIEDLLNDEIPKGCHIIVTTRTYQKETLKLPEKHIDIPLLPFSLEETTAFTRNIFPEITNEEIIEFRKYTYGIPRVQFYSLNMKLQGINEIINFLKPNGKTVEDLILDKIEHAIIRIGKENKAIVEQFFKILITLPRPVPIQYLSEIMHVEIDFLKDLSADIWTGLILEDNLFSFRDEDFENYVKEKYKASLEELKDMANLFLNKCSSDDYSSTNLGNLLILAEDKDNLKSIVLDRKYLEFPKDPIRNKEVYINRTKLALQVSNSTDDNLTYFKLLFIAAQESKTDKALTNLFVNYPDLVTQFGYEISLSQLKLKSEETSWAGSFHLKLAGMYSRKSECKEIALKHLNTAKEWLRWRHTKNEDELIKYPISSIDIAFQTETILKLFDIEKALKSLNSWIPIQVRLSAGNYLIKNIFNYSDSKDVQTWLNYNKFRIDVKIFLTCKLFQFGQEINFDLKEITNNLLKILSKKIEFQKNFQIYIIQFCEILAFHKIDSYLIENLLNLIEHIKLKDEIPLFYNKFSEEEDEISMNITLKKKVLKGTLHNHDVNIEQLYPEKFKDIEIIKDYDKRKSIDNKKRKFTGFYNYAIPIYQLKSDFLFGRLNEFECKNKFQEICEKIENDYNFSFSYQNVHDSQDKLQYLAGKLAEVGVLLKNNTQAIELIIKSFNERTNKLKLRFEILNKVILNTDLKNYSLELLLKEIDPIIKGSEITENEITENYIKCLLMSSKIDTNTGKYFFDEAIKSVTEIDYEAFAQIRCVNDLSDIGITDPNPKLAYEYARFIEYCDLKLGAYEKKHFPYLDGLFGISNLDMSSMFATACRWHHRNVFEIDAEISSLLKRALEKEYINHIVAGALLPLKTIYCSQELEAFYKLLINKFDNAGNSEHKNSFVKFEFRNSQLTQDKHFIKVIYDEIKSGKFINQSIVTEIKKYLDFREKLEVKETSANKNDFQKEDYPHNIDLDTLEYTSTREIEKAIDFIIKNNSCNNQWHIENLFSDIKDKCSPNEYVPHLNALINIDENFLSFYSLKKILTENLTKWKWFPEVVTWGKTKFEDILSNRFSYFDYGNTLQTFTINEFAKLFSIEENELSNIIINILPQKIESLSDESIYSSFELIKNRLTPQDNEDLIEWVLQRWNEKIKTNVAEDIWNEEMIAPKNADENIANLLRFILGHPDKRLRWRAIHSIRRLVYLENTEILKLLLDKQNEKYCYPFQNKKYTYYWMSAKLYLWIAIERISKENPVILLQFKDLFYNELFNQELPHILIKYYIQKSCVHLYDFKNSVYSTTEITNIKNILKSKFEPVKEEMYSRQQRKYNSQSNKNWRFQFDSLDTLPYWYSRVGECFNLSEYDVADIADIFISEKWGYVGNSHDDDYIRKSISREEFYLTNHLNGDLHTIEDLSIYYEYHAMYCAANFLLEKEPLLENELIWRNWLDSEANAFDSFWLSDLRDPLPMETKYWKYESTEFDTKWRDEIPDEYFDENVGFIKNLDKDFLNLDVSLTKNIGANHEKIHIRSCVVNGSEELLRALQTTKNGHYYAMSFESDYEDDEEEYDRKIIKDGEFLFKGWLKNIHSEFEGLDSHDPYFNKALKNYMIFGNLVHNHFDIKYDYLYRQGILDDNIISKYQNWNEISDDRYRSDNTKLETSGNIFQVDSHFLLDFLNLEKKCLIVKCEIERQLEERNYQQKFDDNRNYVKLYLILPDGTVKTVRGSNYKIG